MGKKSHHDENSSLRPRRKQIPKNVVYLIGLPGVGKTTIAKIVAKRTGFVLFDHNPTYTIACHFFGRSSHTAHLLNGQLHLEILDLLLHSSVPGIICTVSIRHQPTFQTVSKAVRLAQKAGVKVNFVKIKCDWKEHIKRVQMPSRKKFHKTNTVEKLKRHMKKPQFDGLKEYPPLIIDNTKLSAKKCAGRIISKFKLPTT